MGTRVAVVQRPEAVASVEAFPHVEGEMVFPELPLENLILTGSFHRSLQPFCCCRLKVVHVSSHLSASLKRIILII